MPEYCKDVDGESFKEMASVSMFQATLRKYPNAGQLQQFLQRCKFKKCEKGDGGTTWLELYILYKMCGGMDGVIRPARLAMKKPSMEEYLKTFKMGLKRVSRETMDASDSEHMQPSGDKRARLRGLGISSHMAMVNMRVLITEDAQRELVNHIIRSQRRSTTQKLQEMWHSGSMVPFGKFNGKGRSAWTEGIKASKSGVFVGEEQKLLLRNQQKNLESELDDISSVAASSHLQMTVPPASDGHEVHKLSLACEELTFKCKTCGDEANAHRKCFDLENRGLSIMCYTCKKTRKSKDWICQCGLTWFCCRKHKLAAEVARKRKQEKQNEREANEADKSKALKGKKRKESLEEGESEGQGSTKRRREEKQVINFTKSEVKAVVKDGLKKSLLSEGLRKIFSHLL